MFERLSTAYLKQLKTNKMHVVRFIKDGFFNISDSSNIQFKGYAYECIDFMKRKFAELEQDNNFGGRWINNDFTSIEVYNKVSLMPTGEKYMIFDNRPLVK